MTILVVLVEAEVEGTREEPRGIRVLGVGRLSVNRVLRICWAGSG